MLVKWMLQKDPDLRPDIKEILKYKWIQAKAKMCRIKLPISRIPKTPNSRWYGLTNARMSQIIRSNDKSKRLCWVKE